MLLTLGIALFAIPHFFSSLLPDTRDEIKNRMGEGPYKGFYSLVTGIGLVLMALAYWWTRGSGDMMYAGNPAMKHVTMLLSTIGFILIGASHGKSHMKLWLQNPMSIGLGLWALGHLLSVGKWAADWIYIAVLAVALVDIAVSTARGKKPVFVPTWRSDIIAVVVGLVLTGLLVMWFHPYVLGVDLTH